MRFSILLVAALVSGSSFGYSRDHSIRICTAEASVHNVTNNTVVCVFDCDANPALCEKIERLLELQLEQLLEQREAR